MAARPVRQSAVRRHAVAPHPHGVRGAVFRIPVQIDIRLNESIPCSRRGHTPCCTYLGGDFITARWEAPDNSGRRRQNPDGRVEGGWIRNSAQQRYDSVAVTRIADALRIQTWIGGGIIGPRERGKRKKKPRVVPFPDSQTGRVTFTSGGPASRFPAEARVRLLTLSSIYVRKSSGFAIFSAFPVANNRS